MLNQAFIFMGKSGSGKGTQAKLLRDYLGKNDGGRKVIYIETGQLLRDFGKQYAGNYTAKLVNEVINEGKLMPAYMPIKLWTDCLINNYTGEEHIIFDGVARRYHEAGILEGALQMYLKIKPHILDIVVSDDWATERLLGRGREDDNEDDIRERLAFYQSDVKESIEYFKKDESWFNYHAINGEQTIEGVHDEIVGQIFNS